MTQKQPLISVCIPAYNHENYIAGTIRSIMAQTYQNIELLVIDDGSKDKTFQIMQNLKPECEKRFANVIFETQQNQGTCITLSRMLDLSRGEYIYIIASDDMSKPQAISKEYAFLSQNPDYALCTGDSEFIDENSKICYWDKERRTVYTAREAAYKTFAAFAQAKTGIDFSSEQFGSYDSLTKVNYIPNGYLVRKSIFNKIGHFTPEAPLEDHWMMLQISKYAKMKYLDEVLFSYRWHSTNSIKQSDRMKRIGRQTMEYEEKLVASLPDPRFKKIFEKNTCRKKSIINLGGLLALYKIKKFDTQKTVLQICGKTFTLKQKDI